jgi:MFS family permease
VFRNPDLRRIQLAYAGSEIGSWGSAIALAVIAYDRGGTTAVGLVLLAQQLPAAFAAPFTGLLGDRMQRRRVMLGADVVRAVLVGIMAALVLTDAPIAPVYVLAAAVAVSATAFRPAQAAMLPTLARTPDELTAANVVASTIESVMSFAGPALVGVLVASAGPGWALTLTALTFVWSALLVAGIRPVQAEATEWRAAGGVARQALAGAETIVRDGRLRVLIGLFGVQVLVWGSLSVLAVPVAFELLDGTESDYGTLLAALGIGGVVGAVASAVLVGRRLSTAFGVGMLLWGAPIALVPAWPDLAGVVLLLAVVGFANTVGDVAGMTLLQRAVPDAVLARVFGVLETVLLASVAIGAVLAPALVGALGLKGALVATGVLLPVLTLAGWRRLAQIDATAEVPEARLALLRAVPFLAPLPPPALEHLAGAAVPVAVAAGDAVFREGDPGDRFYVVEAGEVEISAGGRAIRMLGPGESFGEIALLRDVPRTATVLAVAGCALLALERDEFLGAVTGHAPSAAAADAVVVSRLGLARRPPGA